MNTLSIRRYDEYQPRATVRFRESTALTDAIRRAAREAGLSCTNPALVEHHQGGGTYYVQFGRYNSKAGGTVLSDRYIVNVR